MSSEKRHSITSCESVKVWNGYILFWPQSSYNLLNWYISQVFACSKSYPKFLQTNVKKMCNGNHISVNSANHYVRMPSLSNLINMHIDPCVSLLMRASIYNWTDHTIWRTQNFIFKSTTDHFLICSLILYAFCCKKPKEFLFIFVIP